MNVLLLILPVHPEYVAQLIMDAVKSLNYNGYLFNWPSYNYCSIINMTYFAKNSKRFKHVSFKYILERQSS